VYAVVGQGDQALRYAKRCVIVGSSASLEPFYIGYGYEAEARAYLVLGNKEQALVSKEKATSYLDKVTDKDSHQMLANDLKNL
jgi:predicted RNA-binding protein (virulence factor B family)